MNGGYTRGADGAIIGDTDKATTFGGSDGFGATPAPIAGPDVFSVEAWFKTTTTSGGKIVGFGNANTGTSTNYDRHVYMEPDGRITFGVYHDGFFTATSPSLATTTASGTTSWARWARSGMSLYVDGKQVGRNGGTSVAPALLRATGGSAATTPWSGNAYFAGDIDDVAIYPTALPLTKVQSHYTASGRTLDVPDPPDRRLRPGGLGRQPGPVLAARRHRRHGQGLRPERVQRHLPGWLHPGPDRRVRRATNRPSPSTATTASSPRTRSSATRRTTPMRRGSRPRRTRAARSSASAAQPDRHLGQLRPARLHEQRRQADLRRLDRLHQHHHHADRRQRRPVAPRGGHPEHAPRA